MHGLKKLIFWALVIAGFYYGLDYVKIHTSSDVVAYKRFAKALMEGDPYSARLASNPELVAQVFERHDQRTERLNGSRVLFTYYDVISQNVASDGKSSSLIVEQVCRIDSQGRLGFWGDDEIRTRHTVKMEQQNFLWKVASFRDPAMR